MKRTEKKGREQAVSIENLARHLFFFSLQNLLFILIAVLLITLTGHFSNLMEKQSRSVLLSINRLIVLINEQEAAGENIPSKAIGSTAEDIFRDVNRLFYSIRENKSFPLPAYGSPEERERYYGDAVEFVKMIRDNMNRFRSHSFLLIQLLLIAAALFSIVNMAQLVKWRRYNIHYMEDIRTGMKDLDHILRSQAPAMEYESPVRESRHFFNYVREINRNIAFNNRIRDLSVFGSLDDILEYIYSFVSLRMSCDRIALAFVDEEENVIAETFYSLYDKYHLEPGFTLPLGSTTLKEVADSRSYRIINDLPAYSEERSQSQSTAKILLEGIKSSLTIPIYFQEKCVGFLFISSRDLRAYDDEQAEYVRRITDLLKQKLYIEYILQNVIADTSRSFVTLMNRKDNETAEHISRMSHYSFILARKYSEKYEKLSPKFIREILWYSPLHDIGKVGIPDSILLKEGPLTEQEMDHMKEHVMIGEKVIEEINRRMSRSFSIPALNTAVDLISGHHEKFDGSGYPRGLKGEEIPLAGRIVALADVYDALTSHRPYKKAFSLEKALSLLEGPMAGHFDPKIYDCFKESLEEFKAVSQRYGDRG